MKQCVFKFKLTLTVHFLSVCVVSAVASGERVGLSQGSSTRGPRAACGPPASFVRPGKGISQNTMRYDY